jgi:hypothetical protein
MGPRYFLRKLSKTIFPFYHPLHRLKTYGVKYDFPPIDPIMSHQSLHQAGSPYSVLPLRICVEILDNQIYIR